MKALIVLLPGLLFTSCMHMGMPMMDNTYQGYKGDPVIEKEVTFGGIRAVATFPPLEVGQQRVFTLKLITAASSKPVTRAEAYFHVVSRHQKDSTGNLAAEHHIEGIQGSNITREMMESSDDSGTYTVSYSPTKAGAQDLMIRVVSVDRQRLERALVIEARRMVADGSGNDHGGMMMGSGHSTSTYFLIGGALMAGMMVFMMLR